MVTTLQDKVESVEKELKKILFDANLNIQHVWFGDIGQAAPTFPAVHFMLDSVEKSEIQVTPPSRIGWFLNYTVNCLHSDIDSHQSVSNAKKFVHSVYDAVEDERLNDRLDNEALDLTCTRMEHGFVALGFKEPVMVYGGTIQLIIEVIEIR